MPNVAFLPGLLGSELSDRATLSGLPVVYWIGAGLIGSRGLDPLQLAADGEAPGPAAGGVALTSGAPLPYCYRPLTYYLESLGWSVLSAGYDWRKRLDECALEVLGAVRTRWGDAPFWLVAHSMGGLVSRLVWALLREAGRESQLRGIVSIGTPQYGSWEIPRLFGRLPLLYRGIALACGVRRLVDSREAIAWIDAIVTSWPGAYQLLPCPVAGPLPEANPTLAAALYTRSFYSTNNGLVSRAFLQGAKASWSVLNNAMPSSLMYTICGVGISTPYLMAGSDDISDPDSYLYTTEGDGEVALSYALAPGAAADTVYGGHGYLCLLPSVWDLIVARVGAGG